MSLKKALNGIFWNGTQSVFLQVIQLLVSMVLARLLLPTDFGLIALITVFISVINSVSGGGFGTTIITRPNLSGIDFSTAFVYNFTVSCFLYLGLFLTAPLIADFYNEPKLTQVVRVLSIVNIINAGYFVQDAILHRDMRFRLLATRNIMASLISGCIGILMAFRGFGVWSLVAMTLTRAVAINVYFWIRKIWTISFRFSYESFKKNFGFGSRIMLADVTGVLFGNLNNLLIGKFYSKADLGYYYQANKLKEVPIASATAIITKTSRPLLAKHQTVVSELHKAYAHMIRISAISIIPLAIMLFVFSKDLITVLFSERWLSSVPIFRIIILGGMFAPFVVINSQSSMIMGDSKFFLRNSIVYKVFLLAVTFISLQFGLMVFIGAQAATAPVAMVMYALIARKYFKVGLKFQIKLYAPYVAYSVIAGLSSFLLTWWLGALPLVRLISGITIFCIVFCLQIYLFERRTFHQVLNLITNAIIRLKNNQRR